MSLTLAAARPFLANYVENGQCSNASIVTTKINEAAARLWAMGDWVNTIKRWAVTVDSSGRFVTPTGAQDIRRIAVLGDGIDHSATGIMFMEGADALIYEDETVLPVRQVAADTRQVLGNPPTAVDIMAKVKVIYASADTDLLPIDDVYALKLGVLALYYEDSNQLELAATMWKQAGAYLQTKTDTGLVGARRTKFTTILSSGAQNTAGYAVAKFELSVTDGMAVDSHKSLSLINDAEEVLMAATALYEEFLCKSKAGVFSLPPQYESVYRITVNNCPSVLRSNWFEFVQAGVGYREETRKTRRGVSTIKRGPNALHTDLDGPSQLSVFSQGDDKGVKVNIEGYGLNGSYLRETLTVSAGQQVDTSNIFYGVTSITKDVSASDLVVTAGSLEIAYLYAWSQDSRVMRYAIPSSSSCDTQIIRVIARPRFFPKTSYAQRLQVPFPYAVSLMAQAILAQRAGKNDIGDPLKKEAISHIEAGLLNQSIGEANSIDFQTRGWGFAGLTSRL